MGKKIINISLLLCFLSFAVFSLAAEEKISEEKRKNGDVGANKKEISKDNKISDGESRNNFTIYAAYDGTWFSYTESLSDGSFLDSDEGWLSGGFIELRYDNKLLFVRLNSSITFNAYAKYTGSLLFTEPPVKIIQRCVELISLSEIGIGFKILNYKSFTLSPYNSFGYRFWERYIGYTEDYTWFYAGIGINMELDLSDCILGMDVSVDFPIYPRMVSYGFVYSYNSTIYNVDKSTFVLQSIPGLKIELNIRFNIYSSKDMKVFIFGIPYYQLWNIGASRPVVQTQNGINVPYSGTTYLYLYEPDSITHMGGIKFGFGINFL
jgi:hypothetical protein